MGEHDELSVAAAVAAGERDAAGAAGPHRLAPPRHQVEARVEGGTARAEAVAHRSGNGAEEAQGRELRLAEERCRKGRALATDDCSAFRRR